MELVEKEDKEQNENMIKKENVNVNEKNWRSKGTER